MAGKSLGRRYKIKGTTYNVGTEFIVNGTKNVKNARIMMLEEQHKKDNSKVCLRFGKDGKMKLVPKKNIRGTVRRF